MRRRVRRRLRAFTGSGTIDEVQPAEPSQTAKLAAIARGQHRLMYRQPWMLDDPYALSLVGPAWVQVWAGLRATFPDRVREEAMSGIVARSRYVEDVLEAGTFEQYVILGAGLDSFAWRRPDVLASMRVFEVDHPATQAWKRERAKAMAEPCVTANVRTSSSAVGSRLATGRRTARVAQCRFEARAVTVSPTSRRALCPRSGNTHGRGQMLPLCYMRQRQAAKSP